MMNWQPQVHGLGVSEMDATHEEFVRLVAECGGASDEDFPILFEVLIEHTRKHFENESRLMRACRFPAIAEHESEHRRILGEVAQIRRALEHGRLRLARLYVAQGLPEWFRNHLATMDAALAARLRQPGMSGMPVVRAAGAPGTRSADVSPDRAP
jgi:hemerythrin-like metal-binding protein